jgi:hypothetical protein
VLKIPKSVPTAPELERKAQDAIRAVLASVAIDNVEIMVQPRGADWDFEVRAVTRHGQVSLLCDVKSRAWPNELHAIAYRLQRAVRTRQPEVCVPVLVAPYFSPQAIESCGELGLSWADLNGNVDLKMEGVYVKIRGIETSKRESRSVTTLYGPRSSRVIHALLLEPSRKWNTKSLASLSGVSFGQVSTVRNLLEQNDWLTSSYGVATLSEPKKLLDDWAAHYKPLRSVHRYFSLDPLANLEARLESVLPNYALTEFSAADRYAPYTRYQRVACYVPQWTEDHGRELGLRGGDGASNVTIYETGEDIPFVEMARGSRCVSPIQTYLDLTQLAGRGLDAADYLLKTQIVGRWK